MVELARQLMFHARGRGARLCNVQLLVTGGLVALGGFSNAGDYSGAAILRWGGAGAAQA